MSDNDPQEIARQALENSPGPDNGNNGNGGNGSNPLPIVIGVGVLALVLIGAGLFMLFGANPNDPVTTETDEAEMADASAADEGDIAVVSCLT